MMQQTGGDTEMTDLRFSKVGNDEYEDGDDLEMEMETEMRNEFRHARSLPNTRSRFKAIGMTILLVVAAVALVFRSTKQGSGTSNVSSGQWSPEWAPELNEKNWKLDTNRQLEVFTSKLESGTKYFIKQETISSSSIDIGGETADQTTFVGAESEMTVSANPQGGQEIDITYTRTQMKMDMMGQSFEFDSNSEEDVEDMFKPMEELVGHTIKINVDEDNNIVEASEHEELFKELQKQGAEDLISSKSFKQVSRAAEALPDLPVKPGDEWHTSVEIEDRFFKAQVKLLGYTDYNGHEVAIFSMEGDLDMKKIMDTVGNEMDSSIMSVLDKVTFTDATMTSIIYWDNKDNFARFNKADVEMTMEMQNPVDTTSTLKVPIVASTKIWIDANI